jgi:hypothetical protein
MVGKNHKKNEDAEQSEDAREPESKLFGFRAVYVFDQEQTIGQDLPTLTDVKGDVGGNLERLKGFAEAEGITLTYSERIAPAKGTAQGKTITLLPGMEPAEELSTLVHEFAHSILHFGERRLLTTKPVRETEAEAVAFVVCRALGLGTGSASADYIALWHGDAKLLRESMEIVQRAASVTLGGISPEPAAMTAAS